MQLHSSLFRAYYETSLLTIITYPRYLSYVIITKIENVLTIILGQIITPIT